MDIPTCRPPLDHLLELLPLLQPRFYSISSSPLANPDTLSLTAGIVRYQSNIGRTVKGVATTCLSLKTPSKGGDIDDICNKVPMFIRNSGFRLPENSATPVILIGPGTGLAPLRAFIQERATEKANGTEILLSHAL